jgi:hypothetical protein
MRFLATHDIIACIAKFIVTSAIAMVLIATIDSK